MATYYVSNAGSDSADGLSTGASWQTLDKVNAAVFAHGDAVLFKRGDLWIGELRASGSGRPGLPIRYGAYGSGGNPLIAGSTPLSAGSWTKTGGRTNVYQISVSGGEIDTVWSSLWFAVWDASYRWAAKVASVAACDATAGTCYYDTATDTLYLHTWTSSDPSTDGVTYWVTLYQQCLSTYGYHNIEFEDFDVLYASAHGVITADTLSATWRVSRRAVIRRCRVYGSAHNSFSVIGRRILLQGCEAHYAVNDGAFVVADARIANPAFESSIDLRLHDCVLGTNSIYGGRGTYVVKTEDDPTQIRVRRLTVTGDVTAVWLSNASDAASDIEIDGVDVQGDVGIGISDANSTGLRVHGFVMATPATAYGVFLDTTTNARVTGSVIKGAVAGVALGATTDAVIARNVIDGGATYGVYLSAGGSHTVAHNVITSTGYGIRYDNAAAVTSGVIKNNAIRSAVDALNTVGATTALDEDYNAAVSCTHYANGDTLTAWRASTAHGDHSLETSSPGFQNAGAGDFRPLKTSPLVDAGVNVPDITMAYVGAAPDIGLSDVARTIGVAS